MDFTTIVTRLNELTTFMNNVVSLSKKIFQLPPSTAGVKLVAVYNESSEETEQFNLSEALDGMYSLTNGITALGNIVRDGADFTFEVGFEWKINGIEYANAEITRTINDAGTGNHRIDIAVVDENDDIYIVEGFEVPLATAVVQPPTPPNTLFLCSFLITESVIGDPSEPIITEQNNIPLKVNILSTDLATDDIAGFVDYFNALNPPLEILETTSLVQYFCTDTENVYQLTGVGKGVYGLSSLQITSANVLKFSSGGAVSSVNSDTGAVIVDLESVLTEGGTATDLPITLNNTSDDTIVELDPSGLINIIDPTSGDNTQRSKAEFISADATQSLSLQKNKIQRNKGGFSSDLLFTDPTANRSITFKDESGTVAYLSDVTGVSDGDKGDITVSSAGTVWTIDNGVVNNAKVASGIDAVKIASGVVSNTEFELLNGVTGVIANQAYADAKVADAITNGVTNIAPSQNAVFDALELKQAKPDYMKLTSAYTLASSTSLQKIFNVGSGSGGAYNAGANRTIRFQLEFELTALSSSSGDFKFGVIGTAGIASINYKALSAKSANLDAQNTPFFVSASVATATSLSASTTVTTAKAMIHGTIVTSTAGTIILAVATGVATGACQVGVNSFAEFNDIGADTLGATSNIS